MPKNRTSFRPGQSGNPSGRPKSLKNMRALLEAKYGADAGVLIDRLEVISRLAGKRGAKLALDATELLLAYHSGKPTQSHEVGGPAGGPFKAIEIAMMTDEQMRERALALAERLKGG